MCLLIEKHTTTFEKKRKGKEKKRKEKKRKKRKEKEKTKPLDLTPKFTRNTEHKERY